MLQTLCICGKLHVIIQDLVCAGLCYNSAEAWMRVAPPARSVQRNINDMVLY